MSRRHGMYYNDVIEVNINMKVPENMILIEAARPM